MAYDTTKLTNLGHLETLAEKVKDTFATQTTVSTISDKVDTLVAEGGEPNVIETVKVNGTALTVTSKAVNIDLSSYATTTAMNTAIESAIASTGYASFVVSSTVPTASTAQSNVLYLVMNSSTGYYDIYALVGESVVLLDDVSVDLSDYAKTSDVISSITGTSPINASTSSNKTTISLATSGVTAGSYGPSANATPSFGSTFNCPYITVDSYGRLTAASTKTVKIPNTAATTSTAGLMSAADKGYLDSLYSTYGSLSVATDTEVSEMITSVLG